MKMQSKGIIALPVLTIVLVLTVAVGGYFMLQNRTQVETEQRPFEEIREQGTSDDPSAIEADLEATSFTEIDSDLVEIEAELDAALEAGQ